MARVAGTNSGRTIGKLLAITIALAALGLFAGLNMRSLTLGDETEAPAPTTQAPTTQAFGATGRASDATATERVQARGKLAPRKEAARVR